MKDIFKYRCYFFLSLALLGISVQAYPQDKKHNARVSALYTKIMSTESFIDISAKYKMENGFQPISALELNVYKKVLNDSLVLIEKIKTNLDGKVKFGLKDDSLKKAHSLGVFTYVVKIENNDKFEESETLVSYSEANLVAQVKVIDSVNQIKATLTDASGKPLVGQPLKVGLLRLFAPFQIGKDSYDTDENGSILVAVGEPMPGIDGKLTFEIVLNESDVFGTVKAIVNAPIGIPIVEKSTFEDRTLWSPPTKVPTYMLIVAGLIFVGVWVPLLLLIFNLFRISKSKITQL